MIRKISFLSFFISFSLLFLSCNDTDLTPGYIIIDEDVLINNIDVSAFNATADPQTNYNSEQLEALKSQRFSALWVTINDNDERGVWELPCKIPILASGQVKVRLRPAYQKNGTSSILPGYRMVNPIEKTITIDREEEVVFTKDDLIFTYSKYVKFPLLETFETGNNFHQRENGKGAEIMTAYVDGRSVGLVELGDSTRYFDIMTHEMELKYVAENYTLLEIEYKIEYTGPADPTIPPEFGVEARYTSYSGYAVHAPLVNFKYNNKHEWRTVYVSLADIIGEGGAGESITDFKVCLTGSIPEGEGYTNIKFYFDNIKISTY